jgi:hypothetical protein
MRSLQPRSQLDAAMALPGPTAMAVVPERAAATLLARALGRDGELAAQIVKNTERIESLTRTAAYRIPDALEKTTLILTEVKNVKSLSLTNQLKDFILYGQRNSMEVVLRVRPTTMLSKPLQDAIKRGDLILQFLPI